DAADLREALDVVQVALAAAVAPAVAADAYWRAGELLDFAWLCQALEAAAGDDRWERRATEGLVADVDRQRRAVTRSLLRAGPDLGRGLAAFRDAHAAD